MDLAFQRFRRAIRVWMAVSFAIFPAAGASQGVQISGENAGVPAENDFVDDLPTLMLRSPSFLLTERSRLTFTEVAAESGNNNSLIIAGLGALGEDRDFGLISRRLFAGDRQRLVGIFPAGSLDTLLLFDSNEGDRARPGMRNFAVFMDAQAGSDVTSFYLAYDDTLGDDGDYDDYVIRVDVEPLN